MAYTAEVKILRGQRVESRYNPDGSELDWTDPEVLDVPFRVSLQPASSREQVDGRVSVVSGWLLITPPARDIDLRSTDRLREVATGRVLEVLGDVLRWPHPMRPNLVHHVEATLEEVRD